jgi:hypothetical protein
MRAVRRLSDQLSPAGYMRLHMSLWLGAFEAHVSTSYPNFTEFPADNNFGGIQIVFNAPVLKATRGVLISAALDLVVMLSGGVVPEPADRTAVTPTSG